MSDALAIKSKQQPKIHETDNRPDDEVGHHRIEAKAYLFICVWVFADVLVVFEHPHLSIWFFGVALFIALGLLTLHAQRGWPCLRRVIWWSHFLTVPFLAFILFWISRDKSSADVPHLELGVAIAKSRGPPLLLTNDFFKVSSNAREFVLNDCFGFITLPVRNGESNVLLEFVLENRSKFDAERVRVTVTAPKDVECRFTSQWQEDTTKEEKRQYFLWECEKIEADSIQGLPSIALHVPTPVRTLTVTNKAILPSPFMYVKAPFPLGLSVVVTCKGAPPGRWQFHTQILEMDEPIPKPFAILGERSVSISNGVTNFNWKTKFDLTNIVDQNGNTNWVPVRISN